MGSKALANQGTSPGRDIVNSDIIEVPRHYEFCSVDHVVVLVSDLIQETTRINDLAQSPEAGMTLFHSLYAATHVIETSSASHITYQWLPALCRRYPSTTILFDSLDTLLCHRPCCYQQSTIWTGWAPCIPDLLWRRWRPIGSSSRRWQLRPKSYLTGATRQGITLGSVGSLRPSCAFCSGNSFLGWDGESWLIQYSFWPTSTRLLIDQIGSGSQIHVEQMGSPKQSDVGRYSLAVEMPPYVYIGRRFVCHPVAME